MTSKLLSALIALVGFLLSACSRTDSGEIEKPKKENPGAGAENSKPIYVDTKLFVKEDRKDGKVIKAAAFDQMVRIKGEYRVALADRTPPGQVTILIMRLRLGKQATVTYSKTAKVREENGRYYFEGALKTPGRSSRPFKFEIHVLGARAGEKSRLIMKRPLVIK